MLVSSPLLFHPYCNPSTTSTSTTILAHNSPLSNADAHNCTCTSGILLASCMAGVTILRASELLPMLTKMWPSSTREQDVSRFRSSAFAILRVSLRKRLQKGQNVRFRLLYILARTGFYPEIRLAAYMEKLHTQVFCRVFLLSVQQVGRLV